MEIKVSIVDDEAGVRDQFQKLIERQPGLRCVSVHPNGRHALAHLPAAQPDVVLVDIKMPRLSGIELVRQLRIAQPQLLPVMLTVYGDDESIFESLKAGAVGYLLKRAPRECLVAAIKEVYEGGSPITPEIARRVALFFHEEKAAHADGVKLTPREEEILQLVRVGQSSKQIADQLSVSVSTIHNHLRSIYDKLQVNSRTAAVKKYFHSQSRPPYS